MCQWFLTRARRLLGVGALGRERGQAIGHLDAARAVFDDLALTFDAHRLATSVELGVAVPGGGGEVDSLAASALDAAMGLVERFVPWCVAEVDCPEVVEHRRLVVLDRGEHIVGVALVEQAARGVVLCVHGVEGDGAPGEVETVGQVTHDGDLVGLVVDLFLSQDQAGAMFHRRDHHPAPVLGLRRGATQVFAVHGHRGVSGAVLAGPLADGVVEGLGRKRGEDVVEGGDRRRGIALLARAPERAHGLELVLAEQGGELRERGDPAVAGEPRRDGEREHGVQGVALAPGTAALGHLAQALEQAAQPRRGHRLGARLAVPLGRRLGLAQCLGAMGGEFEHEELLGLAVMAPARRATGLTGIATGQAQRAPVRRAIAGPGKARGVDEGLGQHYRVSMHCLHVPRQPPQAQPQHPRGQVRHPVRRQDDEARVVGDQMQAPELLLRAPPDPAVARGQLERAGLPADQRQPSRAQRRDMTQALAEHAMKRQVVMGLHQSVPAPVFLRAPGRTHRDRAQIKLATLGRWRSPWPVHCHIENEMASPPISRRRFPYPPNEQQNRPGQETVLLWQAVDDGNAQWSVPAYDGGLFSSDPPGLARGGGAR